MKDIKGIFDGLADHLRLSPQGLCNCRMCEHLKDKSCECSFCKNYRIQQLGK